MKKIYINIPRSKRRIRISDSPPDYLLNQIEKEKLSKYDISDESLEMELTEKKPKPIPTYFIQKFVISDSNQPINLSLHNIEEDTLALKEVQIEIQNAYDKGFIDGQESSRAVYETEIIEKIELVRNIDLLIRNLRKNYSQQIIEFRKDVLDLAISIAKKIINTEISENSEIVIEQAKKAIASLDDDIVFKILVSSVDYETMQKAKSELVSDESQLQKVVIAVDKKLTPGSCILHTSAGTIDARINEQLEQITRTLNKISKQKEYEQEMGLESNADADISIFEDE